MADEDRIVSHREYVDLRVDGLEKYLLAKIEDVDHSSRQRDTAAKEAVDKALASQQGINAGQNEWRTTITDIARGNVGREESNAKFESVRQTTDDLKLNSQKASGRSSGVGASVQMILTVIALIIASLAAIGSWINHGAAPVK